MALVPSRSYRSARGHAIAAQITLGALIITLLYRAVTVFRYGTIMNTGTLHILFLRMPRTENIILNLTGLVSFLFVMAWTVRASKNAHLFDHGMRNGPWFAAFWWYLCPIFNLWKPFTALDEIWEASSWSTAITMTGARTPPDEHALLPTWWTARILAGLLIFVSVLMGSRPLMAGAVVLTVIEALSMILIIQQITQMQDTKASGGRPPVSVAGENETVQAPLNDPYGPAGGQDSNTYV